MSKLDVPGASPGQLLSDKKKFVYSICTSRMIPEKRSDSSGSPPPLPPPMSRLWTPAALSRVSSGSTSTALMLPTFTKDGQVKLRAAYAAHGSMRCPTRVSTFTDLAYSNLY